MKKILALALVASLTSCAALQKMSGPFGVCEKADLGQLVSGSTVTSLVSRALAANAASLESSLISLIGSAGVDSVECAVTAYEQTHATSGSGSAVSASLAPSAVARARAVIAAVRSAKK